MPTTDARQQAAHAVENAMAHLDEALYHLDRLAALNPSAIGFVAHAADSYLAVTEATVDLLSDALRDHPNQEVATWLQGLRHLATLMHHTIGRLVRVSPPSEFPLKPDHVDLSLLMQRACDYYKRAAEPKNLKLLCRPVGHVPPAWADRAAVAVVADILLANAVESSDPDGEILVQITPGPGGVVCGVRGHGSGQRPPDRRRPSSRRVTPAASAADEPPTGFGLAIAKELIERMGGRLWVDTAPGTATVVSFRLPYHPVEGSR